MIVKACRWCHGSMMYEVFELKTKEYPLTKKELYYHQQFLWEESKFGELPEDPKERSEFLAKEEANKGIKRKGFKVEGIVLTINQLRKDYPNNWRDVTRQSYGVHCHICFRRFEKEHVELTNKLEEMKGRKDMVAVGEVMIEIERLWRPI